MPVHVSTLKGQVDAVILTIRRDEDQAVAALLGKLEPTSGGRSYRVAKVSGAERDLTVALLRLTDAGNGPAQDAARDAVQELDPRMLMLVGIAGAVPASEFTLGDVMVATRIVDLRVQALVPDAPPQLDLRGDRAHKMLADRLTNLIELTGWADTISLPRPSAPLDADLFKGSERWNEKITKSLKEHFHSAGHRTGPIHFTGTLGSSDFLVKDPAALDHWLKSARKIETVEMEAAGVMEAAARLDATYPVLVVRGISDVVGYERDSAWTAYACQSAAAFAVALLRSSQLEGIQPYRMEGGGRNGESTTPSSVAGRAASGETLEATDAAGWLGALLQGVRGHDAERVRAFVGFYLGSPGRAVAFGGRAAILERLRGWIDATDGRSHCFVIAPTGRGKSALICRLLASLAPRPELATVFLPVSNRFETNQARSVRAVLLERLAHLHGARLPMLPDLDATWTLLAQYLRRPLPGGRRLLLVLDGVDEAADWKLDPAWLPADLAAGTRVLIAARGALDVDRRRWQSALALDADRVVVETLGPLGRADLAEALQSGGLAAVADDRARLEQMVAMSEGDPLVLELLIDELRAQGVEAFFAAPAVDLRPGLDGIWHRQLKRDEEQTLAERGAGAALMAILACALGPIGRDDLLRLAPADLPTGVALDVVHRRLARFVLRTAGGYSFGHPRLREYFRDEHVADRDGWQRRILDDGRGFVRALGSAPTGVPPFVLQLHGAHLVAFGAPVAELLELVGPGWRRAWETRDLGQAGFLADVQRAWRAVAAASAAAVDREEVPDLAGLVRCALCPASIRSQARNLPPELLKQLLARGVWNPDQALAHLCAVRTLANDWSDRSFDESLQLLLPHLAGQPLIDALDLATAVAEREHGPSLTPWLALVPALVPTHLDELVDRAHQLGGSFRVDALLAIARALPDALAERRAELRRDAVRAQHELQRWGFLNTVGRVVGELDELARGALLDRARTLATAIEEPPQRTHYLASLVPLFTGDAQAEILLAAADASCDDVSSHACNDVMALLPSMGKDTARTVLTRIFARSRVDGLVGWLDREQVARWAALTPLLDPDQRRILEEAWIDHATATWHRRGDHDQLRALADVGLGRRARAIVDHTEDPDRRDRGLARLAELLTADEQLALLGRLVRSEREPTSELIGLVQLLVPEHESEVIELLATAVSREVEARGLLGLAARSDEATRAVRLDAAGLTAARIDDPARRLWLLQDTFRLAGTVTAFERLRDAIAALPASMVSERRFAVDHVAPILVEPYRSELLGTIPERPELDASDVYIGRADRIRAAGRAGIARLLRPAEQTRAYLRFAELTDDPDEANAAIREALAAAREIGDGAQTGRTLSCLHPVAPITVQVQVPVDEWFDDIRRRMAEIDELLARWRAASPAEVDLAYFDLGRGGRERQVMELRERLVAMAAFLSKSQLDEVLATIPLAWTELSVTLLRQRAGGPLDSDPRWSEMLAEIIRLARGRRDIGRGPALATLAHHVAAGDRSALIDEALADTKGPRPGEGGDDNRAAVLSRIAPLVGPPHFDRVIDLAASTPLHSFDVRGFVGAIAADLRPALVNRLLEAAAATNNHALIAGLAAHAAPDQLEQVVTAIEAIARGNRHIFDRLFGTEGRFTTPQLERLLAKAEEASRYGHSGGVEPDIRAIGATGAELLRRSRTCAPRMLAHVEYLLRTRARDRDELLRTIQALAPLLRELGGPQQVDAISRAILDIARWWP